MGQYILISVYERAIETKCFDDLRLAFSTMVKELDETGDRNDHTCGEDYEIGSTYAWSNMNDNSDSLIEKLPVAKKQ